MFRVLGDKIVVKKEQTQQTKSDVIQVVEKTEGKQTEGTVLAVGPGEYHPKSGEFIATNVNVGDRILFGAGAGEEFEFEGEKYLILREGELHGILPQ